MPETPRSPTQPAPARGILHVFTVEGGNLYESAMTIFFFCAGHADLPRRFLQVTGDTLSPMAHEFLVEGARPYLEKPIVPNDLRTAVAEAIEALGGER